MRVYPEANDQRRHLYLVMRFAWIPRKTVDARWVWFSEVWKLIDERALYYSGYVAEVYWFSNARSAKEFCAYALYLDY